MELLFIIFVALLLPTVALFAYVKPYADGTKQIDRTKYPTLARAQRIHRYKNVKAREIEFDKKKAEFSRQILAIEDKAIEASLSNVSNVRDMHADEINEWDLHFSDITREKDEAIRKEAARVAAEQRAQQAKITAEIRERELAIWTAQERVRIQQFMADQKAAQALEQEQAAELLRSRENDVQALRKYYVPDSANKVFGYRIVDVHGLYVRTLPVKASRMVDNLTTGAMLSVNGWIEGDELYGNPIWFKLANGAGWVWSGGVDNKSTSGLINYNYMNEPGDSFVQKNAYGETVAAYTGPSEMKGLIDAEIAAIEREKDALSLKMRGSSPWEMMSATTITSGIISADRISVGPNITSITRNGETTTYQSLSPSRKFASFGDSELELFKKSKSEWYSNHR